MAFGSSTYGSFPVTIKGTWRRPDMGKGDFTFYRGKVKEVAAQVGADLSAKETTPKEKRNDESYVAEGTFTFKAWLGSDGNAESIARALLTILVGLPTCVAPTFKVETVTKGRWKRGSRTVLWTRY